MKRIYALSFSLVLLYSCDMENPGGVLLYNQLPESVITFIDEKKILGDEATKSPLLKLLLNEL